MENKDAITLSEQNASIVNQYLSSGEFDSANEVITASLSLLERQKIAALKAAIQEGEDSGFIENYDWEERSRKRHEEFIKNGQV